MKQPMREPSIHISESHFKEILHDELKKWPRPIDDLVSCIFKRARKHSLINRNILATTQKNRKVASKIVQSTTNDARLFSKMLLLIRRKLHHRGVVQIKEDSRDWLLIKQITELALAFSSDFNLKPEKGFQEYIKIALSKLKLFSLQRFPSLHEIICSEYEALQRITRDPHPAKTREAASYYTSIILKKTGESPNYDKIPEKYQYLIQLVDEAEKMKLSPKVWIDAQFSAFDWKSAVPELSQMVGDKAKERLLKYMYQNNIKVNAKVEKKVNFSKIIDRNADRS